MLKIEPMAIVEAYNNGESLNAIARAYGTYPITVRRLLLKNGIELRHDNKEKGKYYVEDGDKLIEWAKAQGRLVTRTELATVIGKKKLSHSYFEKYPELGKYIKNYTNSQLEIYIKQLVDWLNKNNIPYKPSDRTKLGVSVDFLLLGEYSNIALQIAEKPSNVSEKRHSEEMIEKKNRAREQNVTILFLYKKDFKNLDTLKDRL